MPASLLFQLSKIIEENSYKAKYILKRSNNCNKQVFKTGELLPPAKGVCNFYGMLINENEGAHNLKSK